MACNPTGGIDLHVHTTASDGTLSPTDVIALARKRRLGAIAITDHDTLNGTRAALQAGIPPELKFVTGVEISAAPPPGFDIPGSIHILGYGFDIDHRPLQQILEKQKDSRVNRNPRIIERLNALGIDLSLAEVAAAAGRPDQLGRPHIADMLVKKGVARDFDDAFGRYLGTGKPAYVDKYRVDCGDAIKLIGSAGGVAVLAHPWLITNVDPERITALIRQLHEKGLAGIEVFYPEHTPDQQRFLLDIADRFHLLVTGGTDFHGAIKPSIDLGTGTGDMHIPMTVYEALAGAIESSAGPE